MIIPLVVFIIICILLLVGIYVFSKRILLGRVLLAVLILAFSVHFISEYNFVKKDKSFAVTKNSNIDLKNNEILSFEQAVTLLKEQYGNILKTTVISPTDIKYVQIDNDPDFEMVVLIREDLEYNFFIADYKDDKWKFVLKEQNINDYYTIKNNSFLVLTTNNDSPGTGIIESKFYIYSNSGGKYVLALEETKEYLNAKFDSDKIQKIIGSINFIDGKLIYKYSESVLTEVSTVLESKQNTNKYIFKNGKFEVIN